MTAPRRASTVWVTTGDDLHCIWARDKTSAQECSNKNGGKRLVVSIKSYSTTWFSRDLSHCHSCNYLRRGLLENLPTAPTLLGLLPTGSLVALPVGVLSRRSYTCQGEIVPETQHGLSEQTGKRVRAKTRFDGMCFRGSIRGMQLCEHSVGQSSIVDAQLEAVLVVVDCQDRRVFSPSLRAEWSPGNIQHLGSFVFETESVVWCTCRTLELAPGDSPRTTEV